MIQKTRAPQKQEAKGGRGGAAKKKDGVKMRAGVKVGTGCLHVCVFFLHC